MHFTCTDGTSIPYCLVFRPYSRSIRIRVTPDLGLTVSASKSIGLERIEDFLRKKQRWIQKHLEAARVFRETLKAGQNAQPPLVIEFPAIHETWNVEYRATAGKSIRMKAAGATLLVSGKIESSVDCRAALRRWVTLRAKTALASWLAELAATHGFCFSLARVRPQRSRWGSCSAKGVVCLNDKLLFLPREMARSVLLHELCHTRALNHQKSFWKMLTELEPDIKAIDKAMRKAWEKVPAWALRERPASMEW